MLNKAVFLKLTVVALFLYLICFVFYVQSTSHADQIEEIKQKNIKDLEKMTDMYDAKIEQMEHIILDREGSLLERTHEIWELKELLEVSKIGNTVWNTINHAPNFIVTAYDLSVQSCGKKPTHRAYGITRSGKSLKGLDLRTASTISTDPKVIPLGSIVFLYFNTKKEYNGIYIAADTGSAIKGNKIDLFFGDFQSVKPSSQALNFGKQKAKVIRLE